jgi:prepilin-type N-terminal cleavage/methylation domain-containing protein
MKQRSGFTLVELMIAVAIGSIVVLLAHQVFTTVADGISRMKGAQMRLESERLASRWMEATVLSLEAGNGGAGFEGHADRMTFSTWLTTEQGWVERQIVALALTDGTLIAHSDPLSVALWSGVTSVAFDYLLDPGLKSRWVTDWVSPLSAPLAVRIRLERTAGEVDTMLFLVKGRG